MVLLLKFQAEVFAGSLHCGVSTLASFLFIGSHSMLTFFVLSFSGTPDECLTPLVSHPLDSLHFIDRGLGSQVNINSCSTAVSVLWCHK